MELILSPVWQFVGAITSLGMLVLTIILIYQQTLQKKITYVVLGVTPLVTAKEEFIDDLQIMYKGQMINNAYLFIIHIINNGNISIKTNDYEKPITIDFGNDSKILMVEAINKNPDDFNPWPQNNPIKENKICFDRIIINPKDSVTLKTIVNNYQSFSINSRIAGLKKIKEGEIIQSPKKLLQLAIILLFFGSLNIIYPDIFGNLAPLLILISGITAILLSLIFLLFRKKGLEEWKELRRMYI